ncbi:MAG: glycosyltransferase family 4 protein [Verrucomicrobiae bacterium]|nr:glycosyltransferase family 4 protein [Verrucomicrobiae bacterium]
MRFLTVSLGYPPEVPGGAWKVAEAQSMGLAARGHRVEVVTVDPRGDLEEMSWRGGVLIHRYRAGAGPFFARWRSANRAAAMRIRACLADDVPTVILQHHAYLEPAVATAPVPVVHTYHGPWAEEYRYASGLETGGWVRRIGRGMVMRAMRRVEKRALRRASRVLVLSRSMAGEAVRWHGRRLPEMEVVPGGVDGERYRPAPDREAVRRSWGLEGDDILVVAVRRLEARMGLDVLLDAFAAGGDGHPGARLWLTGRGSAEGRLREQAGRLGLEGRVRWLGHLDEADVPRLLQAADVAVMPSLGLEGFGLATVEALACGTPVLGSRAGATPELLEPLGGELLFEAGCVASLAGRLRRVLEEPGRLPSRERCAAYGRGFEWRRQVEACERLGLALVEGREG